MVWQKLPLAISGICHGAKFIEREWLPIKARSLHVEKNRISQKNENQEGCDRQERQCDQYQRNGQDKVKCAFGDHISLAKNFSQDA